MTSTTLNRPVRPLARTRRARALPREILLFLATLAVLALHVLDDNFVQPPPGTSPGDHLVSGLVPLAALALAGLAYPRLRGARRAALALTLGVLGIAAGIEGFHYAREVGPSGDDFTGLLCLPAGVLLLITGAVTLWRTRRVEGSLWWRYPRRALIVAGAALIVPLIVMAGYGYVTTHVGRAVVPADRLGVPHEDVTFTTGDGLELEGWYVPSRNGAAVIAFPGRNGSQKQARMLARHGYGVLLFDRRGEGVSEGEPNSWGWGGYRDVEAAIAYLQRRPDVDPDRIGGIGLSVGGEMLIETAARTDELAAVVSEGAGARSFREDQDVGAQGPIDRVLGSGFGLLKGLLAATLFFLLANLATDMVYGPQAERPEWMTASRTYPLLNASGRGIVDWVEARRLRPRPIGAEE